MFPSFAIALAALINCIAVVVLPCPNEVVNFSAGQSNNILPWLSLGKSMFVGLSKSKSFKYFRKSSGSIFSQTNFEEATLEERRNPVSYEIFPHPFPSSLSLIALTFSLIIYFPDLNFSLPSYTPSSIAAAHVNIFIVDPCSNGEEMTSLYQFFTFPGSFGLKLGRLLIATISPVFGFITTAIIFSGSYCSSTRDNTSSNSVCTF